MIQAVLLIASIISANAFVFRGRQASSLVIMATKSPFTFGKKPTPAPVPAPVAKKPSFSLFPTPAKKAAPAPAPVKKAAPVLAKAAAVVKKAAPVPVKKPAPAPVPVKKAAPVLAKAAAIVKKAAPVPVKKLVPVPVKKAAPAPIKSVSSSGFAYGLVGSDIEAPEFDPLQLSAGQSEETLNWYRAAELKHARICMLAAVGLFVQPLIHLPDPVFDSTLGYGALAKLYGERPEAVWQILGALSAIETASLFKNGQGVAGDLGWDPLNLKKTLKLDQNAGKLAEMQLRELKNGRLAMLGASGLLLQEVVSGTGPYGSF
jgi:hypothetical protein